MSAETLTIPPSAEVQRHGALHRAKEHSAGLMQKAKADVKNQAGPKQSMKESAADMGIWLTEKVTLPAGLAIGTVAAFFAPGIAALAFGGAFYDYAGKEYARDQKKVWEKERLASKGTIFEAKRPAKNEVALAA